MRSRDYFHSFLKSIASACGFGLVFMHALVLGNQDFFHGGWKLRSGVSQNPEKEYDLLYSTI